MSDLEEIPALHASRGTHANAVDGTCLMELASVLAGEKFSDHPTCVHPTLAVVARFVNDKVSDDARQRLVRLLPDMMSGPRDDPRAGLVIALRCADAASAQVPRKSLSRQQQRLLRHLEQVNAGRCGGLTALRHRRAIDRAVVTSITSLQFCGDGVLSALIRDCTDGYAALGATVSERAVTPAGALAATRS